MLTEPETTDLRAFVSELEERGLAGDLYTLARLAEVSGDEWEKLVRECLSQWRPTVNGDAQ